MKDQSANRDIYNIDKVEGDINVLNISTQPDIEKDLLNAVKQWVESTLNGQLHHVVRLNLQKETQPDLIRPWRMGVKVAITEPSQLLPLEMTIGQAFDKFGSRLLILGEPGAGKTTSLLDLALELVTRTENDPAECIPVIVDLSNWQPTMPQENLEKILSKIFPFIKKNTRDWLISDWLATEIRNKYSTLGYPPQEIQKLLKNKRLIPLLDGLDEVRPEYQINCVRAINHWLNSDLRPRKLAVCCRREQYIAYAEKLKLEGAIYLQDLTDQQIQIFLKNTNQDALWQNLVSDNNLMALIRKPLLLSMVIIAYTELNQKQWQKAVLVSEQLDLLLDAYVQKMLCQNSTSFYYVDEKKPTNEESRKWLEILSLQLLRDSEAEFLIEKIQPTYLLTYNQINSYCIILGFFSFLLYSLFLWVFPKGDSALAVGAVVGIAVGFLERKAILARNRSIIMPICLLDFRSFHISFKKIGSGVLQLLSSPILLISSSKISDFSPAGIDLYSDPKGLLKFLVILLTFSIFVILRKEVMSSISPNKGIKDSWKNYALVLFIVYPIWISAVIAGQYYANESITFITIYKNAMMSGGFFTLFIWLFAVGGWAYIKHYILRMILSYNGLFPWNCDSFLNYATERNLLQRVGGRYRFTHDLLRQSLAQRGMANYPYFISAEIFARCGESYRLMAQHDKALKNFNSAIETNPKYTWAIARRGATYYSIGNYNQALVDLNSSIKINSQDTWSLTVRGLVYIATEDFQKALQDFNDVIKIDPTDNKAILNRGVTYRHMNLFDKSIQDFTRIIEIDPTDVISLFYRGETHFLFGNITNALQDFNDAIKLDPKNDIIIANRGLIYRLIGRYEEAIQDLDYAIELDCKLDWVANARIETIFLMNI